MADGSSNPYIRTYAKDMAEASGKPLPPEPRKETSAPADDERNAVLARLRNRAAGGTSPPEPPPVTEEVAAPSPAAPAPIPTPAPEPAPGVPPVPPKPVATQAPVHVAAHVPAPSALPEEDGAHLLELPAHTVTTDEPHPSVVPPVPLAAFPTPPPPVPPIPPPPKPEPVPIPPPAPSAPVPAPMAATAPMPTPPAPAAPPPPVVPQERAVPIPAPVREPAPPAPVPEPAFVSIPPLTPKVPEAPAPSSPPVPAPTTPTPSPIHTYSSDFAARIDKKDASAFSVLAAEADQGGAKAPSLPKPSKNLVIIAVSVLLVFVGAGGLYFAYQYVVAHQTVPLAPSVPSLIFADERAQIQGEGGDLMTAIAASATNDLSDGKVRVLYIAESTTTPKGATETIPLSGGELIGALQLSAPDLLLRNIAPESTVGIVHAGPESRAFFILKVLSYESTFAGMLQWESSMQTALAPLYPLYPAPALPPPTIATTTKIVNGKKVVATTTVETPAPVYAAPQFVDEVASNHDVRALKDGLGRTVLLYGYKDKNTLIIARDEAAFGELVNRLAATKQQ